MNARVALNLKLSAKNDRDFVKLRSLPRLAPTRRADHPRDTQGFSRGVDSANELLDDLGRLAMCFNASRCFDDLWHTSEK